MTEGMRNAARPRLLSLIALFRARGAMCAGAPSDGEEGREARRLWMLNAAWVTRAPTAAEGYWMLAGVAPLLVELGADLLGRQKKPADAPFAGGED